MHATRRESRMNVLVCDIETISQPEAFIRSRIPAFDPDKVALGTASKPEVVAAKIEHARLTHGDDIVAKAALHPEYGQVAIVGALTKDGIRQLTLDDEDDEDVILSALWGWCLTSLANSELITGWNIKGFDLPFLVKRSWILGVKVPTRIYNPFKPKYPWSESIVDLMEVYAFGDFKSKFTSQNAACRALGIEVDEGSGADFGELWKRDKTAALAYNERDLHCASQLAERLL